MSSENHTAGNDAAETATAAAPAQTPTQDAPEAAAPAPAGDATGSEGAAAPAEGQAQAQTDAPKRKRKRRRKKKPEGATAEGQPAPAAEGQEGAKADAPKKDGKNKKKPKEQRERPPFAVGDIVFGKVQDVTDDVLLVDLAGKAVGLFDLRELLIADAAPAAEASDEAAPAAVEASEGSEAEPVAVAASAEAEPVAEASEAAPVAAEASEGSEGEPVAAEASEGSEGEPVADKPADAAAGLPSVVLQPGAQFVGVVHNDGGRGGMVVLTHHPERASKSKPLVSAASKDGSLVYGIVTGVIKGGVEVDVDGLRAFAPASHMDLRMGADLHPLVGQRLPFAVTEYGKRGRDVVLSRRALLEAQAKGQREEALKHLTVGQEIEGVVRTVVPFGAFIDVGGVEGLVPLSEMSHNRSDQPADVFKLGETVKVKLLRIDEKGKLWLSRRALLEDPWATVREKYTHGSRHTGKIARIHPIGAFVELEPGIDGLVRRVDFPLKREQELTDLVKEGDSIEVVVAHSDGHAHRIALHPAPTGAAADEAPQKVALHRSLKVVVVAAEAGGLQVRVQGATGWLSRGYIPASATGTPRGTELRKEFPVGKVLDAKVIDMDSRKGEIKLSIRAFAQDNEREAYNAYRQQVKREAKFGTFADLLNKHVKGS